MALSQIDPAMAAMMAELEGRSKPFQPKLASTLLEPRHDLIQQTIHAGGSRWTTGIPVLDEGLPHDLWLGGHPIGIASVDTGAPGTLNIASEIIATHLIEQARNPHRAGDNPVPTITVFIIAPPQHGTAAIQRVYTALSARIAKQTQRVHYSQTLPNLTPLDPKALLNGISLLQYLDLIGLLETLIEVSQTLCTDPYTHQRTVFLVAGLQPALNSNLRRRGVQHTISRLSTTLRFIHSIARYTADKCLMLVETEIAWGSPYIQTSKATEEYQKRTGTSIRAHDLSSGVLSMSGQVLRYNTHNRLAWMLGGGMDVVVAVHEGERMIEFKTSRDRVVEVVRDERIRSGARRGGGKGGMEHAIRRWCVWVGGPVSTQLD